MKRRFVSIIATGIALLAVTAGAAEKRTMNDVPVNAPAGVIEEPESFGTATLSVVPVYSYDFAVTRPDLDVIRDNGNGYRSYQTLGGASATFRAGVNVPSGVEIDFIALNYCDNSAPNSLTLQLYDTFGDNQFINVAAFIAPDRAGCGYAVSQELNYQFNANQGHMLALYVYQNGGLDGSVSFRGAEVRYRRKVAPAPAVATFPNDVPTSHAQFRFIEALAAAGVTGGCGAGLYCPDAPVTRGQMAVFLASALGLHFPN